ncbi:response regulator [Nocardia sp. IFM 10818]
MSATDSRIRVLVADDHEMFRTALCALIDRAPDLVCVAEVADGRSAVSEIARTTPDVAILDLRMPKLDGISAISEIVAATRNTRVLVLTTYDSDDHLRRALEAGASGFLLKSLPPEEVLAAVRIAARGDTFIDPSVTRRLAARIATGLSATPTPPELDLLTSREHEVLELLAEGYSNIEIASELGVGEQTVKSHVSRLLAKLGLRDRVQAVVYAHRHGVARPG